MNRFPDIAVGWWDVTFDTTTIADDVYNITINATDFAGNQNVTNISQITIDNNPPNTSIVTPLANANISGNLFINASVNETGGVTVAYANVTIYNSTSNISTIIPMSLGAGTTTSGYWNATIDTTTFIPRDGVYNISVNATNSNGLLNISANVSITIDNTPTNVSIASPASGTTQSGSILINASVNDTTSKVFNTTFRLTTATGSTVTDWLDATLGAGNIEIGWWNTTFDTTTIGDAEYNITINATDFAGNQNVTNISTITIDNTAPNNTIVIPLANANISGNLFVNASVNETGGVTVDYVNVTIYNSTSNVTNLIPMSLGAGTTTTGYWNATIDTTTLIPRDGVYNISVNATNVNGLANTSINTSVIIDNTPPNVSIDVPTGGIQSGSILINASVNDTLTQVFNATFRLESSDGTVTDWLDATLSAGDIAVGWWDVTFDTTTIADDVYNITINATDFAGNQNVTNISTITIDNTAPNNTIVIPLANANISGNLFVNASVNETGTVTVDYVNATLYNSTSNVTNLIPMSLGAGTTTTGYWNATIDTTTLIPRDGTYNISINATNVNGLANTSINTSVIIDNTPPNISIITPATGTTKSGSILINASVNDTLTQVFNATFRLESATGTVTDWLDATLSAGDIAVGWWDVTFDTTTIAT